MNSTWTVVLTLAALIGVANLAAILISLWLHVRRLDQEADAEYEADRLANNSDRVAGPFCDAVRYGDRMVCPSCHGSWDVNDRYPPYCSTRKPS